MRNSLKVAIPKQSPKSLDLVRRRIRMIEDEIARWGVEPNSHSDPCGLA